MSNSGESPLIPTGYFVPEDPLANLEMVRSRMDSLQKFLSQSVNTSTVISSDQMAMVSSEITSAIHQIILNGTALISATSAAESVPPASILSNGSLPVKPKPQTKLKVENTEESEGFDWDCEVVELDAVELLAEHIHFCEICGKGFKRDANLRMHMRAHGNQFKAPEALAKPDKDERPVGKRKFSCPFDGCNRNRNHKKFRPLKSVSCVKNHFKRSHCPKMYSCNRCNKKSFSVVSDLKSHLKHCGGDSKWKCSCGTTFSRKDKLFGHMALFEGHMPGIAESNDKNKSIVAREGDEEEDEAVKGNELGVNCADHGDFQAFLDGLGVIDGYSLQDVLGSPSCLDGGGSFW